MGDSALSEAKIPDTPYGSDDLEGRFISDTHTPYQAQEEQDNGTAYTHYYYLFIVFRWMDEWMKNRWNREKGKERKGKENRSKIPGKDVR